MGTIWDALPSECLSECFRQTCVYESCGEICANLKFSRKLLAPLCTISMAWVIQITRSMDVAARQAVQAMLAQEQNDAIEQQTDAAKAA